MYFLHAKNHQIKYKFCKIVLLKCIVNKIKCIVNQSLSQPPPTLFKLLTAMFTPPTKERPDSVSETLSVTSWAYRFATIVR